MGLLALFYGTFGPLRGVVLLAHMQNAPRPKPPPALYPLLMRL
jgi:hypothetical protein